MKKDNIQEREQAAPLSVPPYQTELQPLSIEGSAYQDKDLETKGDNKLINKSQVYLRRIRGWNAAFAITVCALVGLLLAGPIIAPPKGMNQHFFYLARSFSEGKLYVDDLPSDHPDAVEWQGHKYLPFGPLPAVLLIPFLPFFSAGVHLLWIGYLFTLFNLWLFHRVLGLFGIAGERRRWALLLFFGGTVYYSVTLVGSSYFFAHIVVGTFLLAAILEALDKGRPWILGLLLGFAIMTRVSLLAALPFFIMLLWWRRSSKGDTPNTASLFLPLARDFSVLFAALTGPIAALLYYNYLRFGNPLESGYSVATLGIDAFQQARNQGLFSVQHIPKNLVMMLFQGPRAYPSEDAAILQFPYLAPSQWGMGLIYTSPGLFYAFAARLKDPLVRACWVATIFGMLPVITYYGVGWLQFGYRYALDFLPFLILLSAKGFPTPMPGLAKTLVLVSVTVSTWGALFLLAWIYGFVFHL